MAGPAQGWNNFRPLSVHRLLDSARWGGWKIKALNSGKERVVAATVGSLQQFLARTGYSTFGWRDTDGNVLAISHLSSQRLAFALVITCVIAITIALFPVDGFAQTPPNNAATGAPSITGAARLGQSLTVDTSGVADADGNTKPRTAMPVSQTRLSGSVLTPTAQATRPK